MRMGFRLLVALLALTASAPSKADYQKLEISVGARTRKALYLAPKSPAPDKSYSLLFVLHGGGGTPQGMGDVSRLEEIYPLFEKSWIFVFPQGEDKHWNDSRGSRNQDVDDLGYFDELLGAIQKVAKIDSRRIFATGISNGGMMSFRLACTKAWLRAFAPVAATMPAALKESCRPTSPRSMLLIVGERDPLVPYKGGEVTGPFGARKLGKVLGAEESLRIWKDFNACTVKTPSVPAPATRADATSLTGETWSACADKTRVELVTVIGGGHTWPGGKQYLREWVIGKTSRHLDASKRILEFFESLP
jgi:polyhydroxybutyrate depolymerase